VNWVELVVACENMLGWLPREDSRKARATEAGILKRTALKEGVSAEDLVYVLGWARDRKVEIRRPSALVYLTERAFRERVDDRDGATEDELRELIRQAAATETDEEWQARLRRVVHAPEPVAREVYEEWAAHG
jgi:hypothetical protein